VKEKFQWLGLGLAMAMVVLVLVFSWRIVQQTRITQEYAEFESYLDTKMYADPGTEDRMHFFLTVHGVVSEVFPYLHVKEETFGYDWQDIKKWYAPRFSVEGLSEQSYFFSLSEMLSLLDDPGTRLSLMHLSGVAKNLLINISRVEDAIVLESFHEAFRSNEEFMEVLVPGDELLRVDDRNALSLYQVLQEDSIYGLYPLLEDQFSERFFMTYYHQYLEEIQPEQCKLDFVKPDGTQYSLMLDWNEALGITGTHGVIITSPDQLTLYGEYIQNSNLAYIQINQFSKENIALFQSEMARMQNTAGLILDLRGADSTPDTQDFMKVILGYFVDAETTVFYEKIRYSSWLHLEDPDAYAEIPTPYYPVQNVWILPGPSRYTYPVVVLVDENYLQSPDDVLVGLRDLAGATMIGRGFDLHVLGHPLSITTPFQDYAFQVSTAYLYDRTMKKMENEALVMDRIVPYTREEALGSVDPILRTAIEWFDEEV